MKIKEQTRKLAAGCSKHCFEVADKVDAVWRDFRRVLVHSLRLELVWKSIKLWILLPMKIPIILS